jgi:hypothetical protein
MAEAIGQPNEAAKCLANTSPFPILIEPNCSRNCSVFRQCHLEIHSSCLQKQSIKMEGYSKLAELMANPRTDSHFLIFQKFESISAQNLLYLQAEIINLKECIDKIARIDSKAEDRDRRESAVDWEALSSATNSTQWEKWLELRQKLKEFCKNVSSSVFFAV